MTSELNKILEWTKKILYSTYSRMNSCIWIMNQVASRVGPAQDWLTWTNYPSGTLQGGRVVYSVWGLSRGGGGGRSLIWPPRCAAEQGTVFKVLSLKQGMQFHP